MIVITVARKPIEGTVAANALKWGTGGINIDSCRIVHTEDFSDIKSRSAMKLNTSGKNHDPNAPSVLEAQAKLQNLGRWPANLILCPDSADALDDQSGDRSSPWIGNANQGAKGGVMFGGHDHGAIDHKPEYRDGGGASRYFKVVGP